MLVDVVTPCDAVFVRSLVFVAFLYIRCAVSLCLSYCMPAMRRGLQTSSGKALQAGSFRIYFFPREQLYLQERGHL